MTATSPFNTTWYNTQTTFSPPPTKTHTLNATAATAVAARTSYCPLSDDDIADGWTIYDLPAACANLLNPYCWPDPNKPILPSTKFPAVCTPSRASATSSTPPTNAIPTPLEPSTISSCKQYYKVLDGDNCYSIANNFKITTTQVCVFSAFPSQSPLITGRSSTPGILMLERIALSSGSDIMFVSLHEYDSWGMMLPQQPSLADIPKLQASKMGLLERFGDCLYNMRCELNAQGVH